MQNPRPEDIRATLAVSQEEARLGGSRVVNLPNGQSRLVSVPAGARDGEELRLPGQGMAGEDGMGAGDLILRLLIITPNYTEAETDDDLATQIVQVSSPFVPPAAPRSTSIAPSDVPASRPFSPLSMPETNAHYTLPQATAGAYPPYSAPSQTSFPSRQRGSVAKALTLLIVLVLVLGSALFFYLGYYQPDQQRISGTATAQAQVSNTVNAQASGTARAVATSQAQAQATGQAFQNIYTNTTAAPPVLNETLHAQTDSQWDTSTGANGSCAFSGGSYHSSILTPNFFQPCYAEHTNFSNFAFQVEMTMLRGDEGGIIFRADNIRDKFYLFRIDASGNYSLYLYIDNQGSHARSLLNGTTNLMHSSGQSNLITLIAQHDNLILSLNQHYLASVADTTYSAGKIGVFAESATQPTDVSFRNVMIWLL